MDTKALTAASVEVKDEEKGEVRARFATMNVKDKDGDLILPGAFGKQSVLVSAYGHATWRGALPVGKGTIHEDGDDAIADLRFFMDTDTGREHFRTIKNVGTAGEWSFGFDVTEWAEPDEEQRQRGIDRVIKAFEVHEVSPVFRGAGVNTATLAVKAEDGRDVGVADLLEDGEWVKALAERLKALEAPPEPPATGPEAKGEADADDPSDADDGKDELLRAAARLEAMKASGL